MKFNFYGKTINQTVKKFFLSVVLVAAFALTVAAQTGIIKFDYEYKSNAQGKMKAEQNRGRKARMYWNAPIKRWTVEVDYGGSSSDEDIDSNTTDDENIADSSSQTRTIIYHYEYKSNAQGKLKTEQQRGKTARMFYDKNMRRWAVEVEEPLNVSNSDDDKNYDSDDETPTLTTTKKRVNTSAEVGSGKLPNGATVSYFPDKTMAEEIHKAAIKQGDWTKMWYDENRRAWAVAIKVR